MRRPVGKKHLHARSRSLPSQHAVDGTEVRGRLRKGARRMRFAAPVATTWLFRITAGPSLTRPTMALTALPWAVSSWHIVVSIRGQRLRARRRRTSNRLAEKGGLGLSALLRYRKRPAQNRRSGAETSGRWIGCQRLFPVIPSDSDETS